jgi:hypothetical protein
VSNNATTQGMMARKRSLASRDRIFFMMTSSDCGFRGRHQPAANLRIPSAIYHLQAIIMQTKNAK